MKKTLLVISLLMIVGAPTGAGVPPTTAITGANNRFCADLYGHVRGGAGNLAFSPYSITSALAMTYAGARGKTEEEMSRVLHLPFGQDSTHPATAALMRSLLEMAATSGCTLSVANRLWGQKGASFLAPFLEVTRDDYGAELERLDFARKSEDARRHINDWTQERTRGMITDLLQPGSITDLTRLVLTNAIYFKARWQEPFESSATRDRYFFPSRAETVNVPMMFRTGRYPYAHEEGVQVLVLDYAGKGASMVVLLPDAADGLGQLESESLSGKIEPWIKTARETNVEVSFPRFRATSSFSLAGALSSMGMPSAFIPGEADFSGMDGSRKLIISAVVHKAVVDVAEEGTEAAAATAVLMMETSMPVSAERPVVFKADHPFLFLIRDNATGCILFIGRVTNPLQ